MYKSRKHVRNGTFDPSDTKHIKHTQIGVWDLYEETESALPNIPGSSRLESYLEIWQNLPYVWHMLKDISSIRECWLLFTLYVVTECIISLIPAVSLWYSAQLLNIVQAAVDERTVNKKLLFEIAAYRLGCLFTTRIMNYIKTRCVNPLNLRIKQFYSIHTFHAMARLDVPTFDNDAVQRQLEHAASSLSHSSIAWTTVSTALHGFTKVIELVSQLSVLVNVLRNQRDGPLLAILSFSQTIISRQRSLSMRLNKIWAATTRDADYILAEGLKRTVGDASHRKEIVAGGLQNHLFHLFRDAATALGDRAGGFHELWRSKRSETLSLFSFLQDPLRELPQIVFTLRAVQYPSSIPVSLASLNLITQTTTSFAHTLVSFYDQTGSLAEQLADVRRLYEVTRIPNQVEDGKEPYPENEKSLEIGISVEFRNVSFRYPGSKTYALHRASFKIEKGQLCIIVGVNGSGKSTILKLISRLYDPCEGEILIDGRDIRLLRLNDLRHAISVLFQDYTLFPLSIKQNIGLGDPENAGDDAKVHQAAELGGAEEFIEKLPDEFNTYLERPVMDYYSALPEGTTSLFGRPVDYGRLRTAGRMNASNSKSLSGGQIQRIALSRSFMRSLVAEPGVGLLLFDEPSASLDPKAEHDLFERLRRLRGNKTMIFSSHRFGNLTRHADLILYIHDASVVEEGTHDELLKRNGEYAQIWNLQAQAFLS